jgi:hypothetical protein
MWFSFLFVPRPRREPARCRLTVEALEDRTVPSSVIGISHPGARAGIIAPLAAAPAHSFQASGTFVGTNPHADHDAGTLSGTETILGSFTGTFDQHGVGTLAGTAVLTFSNGSSLALSYRMTLDHSTNTYSGTYTITGGTGALAGATGSGSIMTDHGTTGSFSLTGTISE